MKTSIVIPVMNDNYIYKCLGTILKNFGNKILKNKEIIVVNDKKSNENFSKKLNEFCRLNGMKYHQAKEPGASANRNLGMELAKGENILFTDSDCFPHNNWIKEMEKSLEKYDLVEGRISYESKDKPLFDRLVENKSTQFRFLTANLGIKKGISKVCKFDNKFIVFREDTDFGLSVLEKGYKAVFNEKAEIFHRKGRFTIKRFIFERKRYIGEPLFLKKHIKSKHMKMHVPRFGRILHPVELFLLGIMFVSLAYSWKLFIILYLLPGFIYCAKEYLLNKRTFNIKDTILILILLPLTMIIKRIYIWKGSIKFDFFVI
jgi:glycosyltransferase involved in cell wall biosynthesis